jgi:hypothetical protein
MGLGESTSPTSGTGQIFGVLGSAEYIVVPNDYNSGDLLNGSSIYAGESMATLGITPGEYTWTWGSGVNADSLIVTAAIPEPRTYAALVGLAALALVACQRRK